MAAVFEHNYEPWQGAFYKLEALSSSTHLPYEQVLIVRDLLTLVHSAAGGFDHSAEIWPRVRSLLDQSFPVEAPK